MTKAISGERIERLGGCCVRSTRFHARTALRSYRRRARASCFLVSAARFTDTVTLGRGFLMACNCIVGNPCPCQSRNVRVCYDYPLRLDPQFWAQAVLPRDLTMAARLLIGTALRANRRDCRREER